MATLSPTIQAQIQSQFMHDTSIIRQQVSGVLKADLLAAVQAIDTWIDTNAVAFNSALPVAARNNLTQAQKLRLFVYVAQERWGGS